MEETHNLTSNLHSQLDSLRARVKELEIENAKLASQLSLCRCTKIDEKSGVSECNDANPVENTGNVVEKGGKSKKKKSQGWDVKALHHWAKRYIALKVMYFGQRFYGFASEAQMEPTVESELFNAFEKTRLLLGDRKESQYSRCGRTDKGVSAAGQVIALYVRSNLKDETNSEGVISEDRQEGEIDYVRVLNRVLPRDIRIISWCPVPADFHASVDTLVSLATYYHISPDKVLVNLECYHSFKHVLTVTWSNFMPRALVNWFSCLSREYKYFFWGEELDISAMKSAGRKFLGEHDFRNFCKMDAANVHNYKRNVISFDISRSSERWKGKEVWAIKIRGSAFLWHQVRCMVAVLFMIGQGLESEEIIDLLLDIEKTPKKPQYIMAPELPLVLHSCEFKGLTFSSAADSRLALCAHLENECESFIMQAAIFYNTLSSCTSSADDEGGGSLVKRISTNKYMHVPVMKRPTEPSYEERRAKLSSAALKKGFVELSLVPEAPEDSRLTSAAQVSLPLA